MNRADTKANLANCRAEARRHPTPMLIENPAPPPGWQVWRVATTAVLLPALRPDAPASIRRRYRARIIANATGECPRCGAVAGDQDGSGHADLAHENGCPVGTNFTKWLVKPA